VVGAVGLAEVLSGGAVLLLTLNETSLRGGNAPWPTDGPREGRRSNQRRI